MRCLSVAAASLLFILSASNARASESDETIRPAQEARTWYGWQTLATDGASSLLFVSAFIAPIGTPRSSLGFAGLGVYGLGGPVVHMAHGNYGRGFGSFGMRAGMPVGGAIIGYVIGASACRSSGESGCLNSVAWGTSVGALVGFIGASAIDASLLAYQRETKDVTQAGIAVVPQIDPVHRVYGVNVTATNF